MIIISSKYYLFSPWYYCNTIRVALIDNHSLTYQVPMTLKENILGKQRTTDADTFGLAWHKHVSRVWTLYTKYLVLTKLNKDKQLNPSFNIIYHKSPPQGERKKEERLEVLKSIKIHFYISKVYKYIYYLVVFNIQDLR